MSKPIKPSSFAKALLLDNKQQAEKQRWLHCLSLLSENRMWCQLVKNPLTKDKTIEVIKAILDDDSWQLESFVHALMKYHLLLRASEVYAKYQKLILDQSGTAQLTVASANELSEEMQENINQFLQHAFNIQHVETEFSHQPNLLAGFKAKWGDKVLDHSLLGKLKNLNNQLIHQ